MISCFSLEKGRFQKLKVFKTFRQALKESNPEINAGESLAGAASPGKLWP